MFWVIFKNDSGLVGIVTPNPQNGGITNNYLPDELYIKVLGKSYTDLVGMYDKSKPISKTRLYKYLIQKFKIVDKKQMGTNIFYKIEKK